MKRQVLVSLTISLALACASQAAQRANAPDAREKDPAFRYGRNPGQAAVGAIPDILLSDPARNRSVKLSIDYPTRGDNHPLIVISHAGGLSNRSYPGLSSHWASYGYVVIRPSHEDKVQNDAMTTAEWRDRARDITFILDSLGTLAEQYPELKGKIDTSRIAVVGHGRGATTALMLAGLRTFPGPVSFADSRIKAVVAMSPNGPTESWGITPESFAELRVPVLYMTGSRDNGMTESETPQWRQQAFELSPAGDKWLISMEGVNRTTFTGQVSPTAESKPLTDFSHPADTNARQQAEQMRREWERRNGFSELTAFSMIRALAQAFLDTYLTTETKGRQYLDEIDARPSIEVKRK
jgi:predicted dienelactone hydrolase